MSPATGNCTRGATEKQIQYVDKIVYRESGSVQKSEAFDYRHIPL